MLTQVYLPPSCVKHNPHDNHPEHPSRITAIKAKLEQNQIANTQRTLKDHSLSIEVAAAVHDGRYIEELAEHAPREGLYHLDGDTTMDPFSLHASLTAAGTVRKATQDVVSKQVDNAFCVVRPPGHHAEYRRGMGFCFINSIALAAHTAVSEFGMERVAILDFDVHQGNGTEDIVQNDSRILFCSSYQHPHYPHQNNPSVANQRVNVPLNSGCDSATFRNALNHTWWPALKEFEPELILVSAGFDAHRKDPLAGLNLETEDFAWLGEQICEQADTHCDGRVVAALEGGYHLQALADSTHAFIRSMSGHQSYEN